MRELPRNHATPSGEDILGQKETSALRSNKTVAEVLGEIIWLMSQDSHHKNRSIASLERDIMLAIMNKQFKTFYTTANPVSVNNEPNYSEPRPVGFIAWALTTDSVARSISRDATYLARLTPADWCAGAIPVITVVIAPFGGADEMITSALAGLHHD